MKVLRYFWALVAVGMMYSCDILQDEENDATDDPQEEVLVHKGTDVEFQASGVIDENLLGLCLNMTHELKYEISGLENCSWVRVRYAQNVDGHDWMPYITVDPNTTGVERRVEITILYQKSEVCRHTIVQHP